MKELESDQAMPSKLETANWRRPGFWISRILIVVVGIYLLMLALLLFNENDLVYPGSRYPKGDWDPEFEFEEVNLQAADGTELIGWYLPPPASKQATRCRTILILHGNAENVAEVSAYAGQRFRQLLQAEVFTVDYRGFGKSDGRPNELGVMQDSNAALDWICERSGKSPNQILLVGHSLGGGPAVELAQQRGAQALILQRTYSSLPDAAAINYPMFPVRWLMQNQFASIDKIGDCPQPLFQSHGSADQLIPIRLAKQLFETSPAREKEFFEVAGMSHWDPLPDEYWPRLKAFIDRVAPLSEPE